MKVKALNKRLFLSWVNRWIEHNVWEDVPDAVYTEALFSALVEAGEIEVGSFANDSESMVIQQEFNQIAQGLFSLSVTTTAGQTGNFERATTEISDASLEFVFPALMVLTLKTDGLYTESYEIVSGTYTHAAMVALLDAQFTHVDFDNSSPPVFQARTKSRGATSSIEVLAPAAHGKLNANDILGLPVASTNTSTCVASLLTVTAKNPVDQPAVGVTVIGAIYDAASAGALDTEVMAQAVSKGTQDPVSTLYGNTLYGITDENGKFQFEVVRTPAASVYLQVNAASGHDFARMPAARTTIVIT